VIGDVRRPWARCVGQVLAILFFVELKSVGVNVVVEVDCGYGRVGLAEVDTTGVDESMGCYLAAVSVGERDMPVCVDGGDAGESKEYSLESNHFNCWVEISRVGHRFQY